MGKTAQQGIAQVFVLLILLLGIVVGTYLVGQQTGGLPQAAELKDYLTAQKCGDDSQCNNGFVCQNKTCDSSKECNANPKGAYCALKLRLCGGICVAGVRVATPSAVATSSATPAASPLIKPKPSPAPKYSTKPRASGQICAQVITRACPKNDPNSCKIFGTPCDIPDGWVIAP